MHQTNDLLAQVLRFQIRQRQAVQVISPVEYLERRVADLKLERPLTVDGYMALTRTISELQQCIVQLKAQALASLSAVMQEHQ